MRIDDLVTFASAEALEAAEANARAATWKAMAVGEAERIRMQTPGCDRFVSGEARLGMLRLDGADLPVAASVSDGAALAGYLAEHSPQHAAATVTVPAAVADLLAGALEALGVQAAVKLAAVDGAGWVKDQCKVVADAEKPGAWKVLHVTGDGTATEVPGVTASRPSPTWKLIPNSELRKERVRAAAEQVADQVDAMQTPTPQLTVVADPAPEPASTDDAPAAAVGRYRGARTVRELRAACKSAGLPVSGTGAELQARLDEAQHAAAGA